MILGRTLTPVALMLVCLTAANAEASSANFRITATGTKLVASDEATEIPQFTAALEVGQTATFAAQGLALPRGGKPAPFEPDAGAWLFDDESFQLQRSEKDKEKADKSKIEVSLKALKPGKHRLRFVGIVLGYERKFDVTVTVSEPKSN